MGGGVGYLSRKRGLTIDSLLADEGEARVREAYPGATRDRLAAVKAG